MGKIIFFSKLDSVLPEIRKKKSVLAGGCFDVLHYGHLIFLQKAKNEGDFLVIALESDEFIKQRKKRNPIHSQDQRAEILVSLSFVDLVVKLPLFKIDSEYEDLVRSIKPSVIAVTEGDRQIENKRKQAKKIAAKLKVVSNLIEGFSSNMIIKALD